VPFDSGGAAVQALAGKHVDFAAASTTSALPLVKAGKLNAILVLANSKDIVFPNIPLAKDLGYNFPIIPMLRGADAPPKTPVAVIRKLEEAFAKAVKEPAFLTWAKSRMMEITPLNSVEYGNAIGKQQKEIENYKSFLKYEN
jgi:tripartite-type tricarboxylate transporter receptor subunit TctC